MLVAEFGAANALRVLDDRATITRLGRGVDRTRRLAPDGIERTLGVLAGYVELARRWSAPVVAVGTSAIRDADNRDEFLAPAERILGCRIQTISGGREAELTFQGALDGIDVGSEPLTVVDIGGGSTEIIVGAAGVVRHRTSLDFGSVRMHERHGMSAPASLEQQRALRDEVRTMLAVGVTFAPVPRLLAIAGTATTLAAIAGEVDPYDRARVHGARVTRDVLGAQVQQLAACSIDERCHIVGLDPARADVIATGAIILEELLRWSGADELTVSDGGVRFGLAREALGRVGVD